LNNCDDDEIVQNVRSENTPELAGEIEM